MNILYITLGENNIQQTVKTLYTTCSENITQHTVNTL